MLIPENKIPTTTLTLGSLAALAGINHSDAAIIYFDVNPDQTFGIDSALNFGNVNLSTATYTLNSTSGITLGLDFTSTNGGLFGDLDPLGNIEWGFSGSYVERLSLNDGISGGSVWSWGATPAAYLFGGYVGYYGNWGFTGNADSQTGFAPLRINAEGGNYNYGWVEVTAQVTNRFSNYLNEATVTVTGFAFEDTVNTAIHAGEQSSGPAAVPEPGQVAASLLLLTGIAGYLAYRRRIGAATEPATPHNLALGARGIADFRADKQA